MRPSASSSLSRGGGGELLRGHAPGGTRLPSRINTPPPRESDEEALGRIMRRSRAEATRLKKQGLPLEGAREGRFFYGSAPDARDSRAGLAVVPELPFLRAVAPQKTTLGIGVGCMRRRGLIPLNAIPTTS